jgi:type II secretory pathway pseudopilin PulG
MSGFSLVEMIVGVFIMALVISGGLAALTQATTLSEKTGKQSVADFLLRAETEHLRSMHWTDVEQLSSSINNSQTPYAQLQSISTTDLTAAGMDARVNAADLNSSGQVGKKIFRITLNWSDRSGKSHSESRVVVITEGGISA